MQQKKMKNVNLKSDYTILKEEYPEMDLGTFLENKRSIFKKMFEIQYDLNVMTNGKNWYKGKTKNGLVINWDIALYTEIAELIESFNWKHWKNDNPEFQYRYDKDNLIVETVDILHFIISVILEKVTKIYTITKGKEEIINKALDYIEDPNFTNVIYATYEEGKKINKSLLIEDAMSMMSCGYNRDIKKLPVLFHNFLKLVVDINYFQRFNLMDMYKSYVCKSFLNTFRQENGYKEGTYVKYFNGQEDNVTAFEVMKKYTMEELVHDFDNVKKDWFLEFGNLYNNRPASKLQKLFGKLFSK